MRKIVVAICFMVSLMANAQGIGNIKFGAPYNEALVCIKDMFGEPVSANSEMVTYNNVSYKGFKWNELVFRFTNGHLVEARYYMNQKDKAMAKRQLDSIAKAMEKSYAISRDFEDDGNVFYAGGISPMGMGRLFTIFVSPRNGSWTSQLRFGPFRS